MPSFVSARPTALAGAVALALLSLSAAVRAQATPATLAPVVVTGNPLGSADVAAPVSVLGGDALTLRRASTLGETLDGLPGVSASAFGPNASRPVIRGLDGERVKVLENGGTSFDAATLSYDHAVPIDPLVIDRVEVLRGPAALFYGGNAIGGAVNAFDNRIPREALKGVSGAAELRAGGAARERGGAAKVEAGNGRFALHVDAFGRETDDLRVPDHVPLADGEPLAPTDRVRNSASRNKGGAVGGTVFFDRGHAGLSVDTFDSRYGVVVEPDVTVRMKRDRYAFAGELRDLGPFKALRVQAHHTDYEHREIEGGGEVGTTFDTRGNELRIEAEHGPLGPLRGLVGVQLEDADFSALGEEAFVPSTHTRKQSLFLLESMAWAGGTLQGGLRTERVKVRSEGDADAAEARFGPAAERSFSLGSASVSNVYALTPTWRLTGALSYTERAPTSFELFANGVHAATGTFERGDATLGAEKGTNLDVALGWKQGASHLRAGAFVTRFSRYLALDATGTDVDVVDEDGAVTGVPEYAFRAVRARLYGVELEGGHRLLDRGWTLDVNGKVDLTRGTNRDTGEPLARIAPARATVGADATVGLWTARAELQAAARQTRVPSTDRETAGFGLVHLSLARRFTFGAADGQDGLAFVKVTNVGDKLAYHASSIDTVRGLSPVAGRAVQAGVRVDF